MDNVVIPKNQMQRIEHYLKSLSETMRELLNEIRQSKDNNAVFKKLVGSNKFQKEVKRTEALYKRDTSKFINLYKLFRNQTTQ